MSEQPLWRLSRRETIFLAAVLSVACVAYLFQIDARSLWLDEVMSLNAAAESWGEKWDFFQTLPEQHPFYYVLLTGWIGLGESEAVLRGFSVVWGVASGWGLYLLARRLFGTKVAVVATLLFVVSPYWIYYSQEARMYTLLGFLTILSHLLYVWWRDEQSGKAITAYITVGVLGAYTHLFFLFVPLAHVVAAWFEERHSGRGVGSVVAAAAAIYASYLPWAWVIVENMPEGQSWKGLPHLVGGLPYALLRFSVGYAELTPFLGWKDQIVGLVTSEWPILVGVYSIFGGLAAVGTVAAYRQEDGGPLVLSAAVVPVVGMYLLSAVTVLIGVKYLTVVFPLFVVLVALGWTRLASDRRAIRRGLGIVTGVAVVLFTGKALVGHYGSEDSPKADWRDAAEFVAENARPGDAIAFHMSFVRSPFHYYYDRDRGPDLREIGNAGVSIPSSVERIWVVVSHAPRDNRCADRLRSLPQSSLLLHRRYRNGAGIETFLVLLPSARNVDAAREEFDDLLNPCLV